MTHPHPSRRPAPEADTGPDEASPTLPTDLEQPVAAPDGGEIVAQAIRAGVGAAMLAAATLAEAIRRTLPVPPPTDEAEPPRTDALALLTGAALGATVTAGEAMATAAGDLVRAARPVASWWLAVLPLGSVPHRMLAGLEGLDARWQASRPAAEDAASAVARELVPQIADAVLDQLDLTWLVAERVDVDALAARIDVDAIVERVDLDRILARIDLDRVADGIDVDAVVARVDLDRIVERIDVNEVAKGIDLEAIIDRIDVAGIAAEVIEDLDIATLIRESTEAVTTESVRGIRVQSANADRYIQDVAARVLRRRAKATEDATGGEPPSA
jgi:hypothetical protein